jgi:hypothetical protein
MAGSECSQKPFIYKNNIIRYNHYCEDIPYTTQLLLGSRFRDATSFYLFWDPVSSTLTTGLNVQIVDSTPEGTPPLNVAALASQDVTVTRTDPNTSRVAFLAARNLQVFNGNNVVVAGLELPEPFTLSNFSNSLVTGNLVTNQKVRIGSLIDQGHSYIYPPTCATGCIPVKTASGYVCSCPAKTPPGTLAEMGCPSERGCSSTQAAPQDPILDVYGDALIRANLTVGETVYCDSVLTQNTVGGQLGTFSQVISGNFVSGIDELAPGAFEYIINGNYRQAVIQAAPLDNSVIILLDSRFVPFIRGTTLTIKDITQRFQPTTPHNIIVQVSSGIFIETYDENGLLTRVNGGQYVLDTVGGAVTFIYSAPLIPEGLPPPPSPYLVWEIVSQFKGNPRSSS